jgi:hypothetical protein
LFHPLSLELVIKILNKHVTKLTVLTIVSVQSSIKYILTVVHPSP